jgi:hypothetical protein
LIPKIVDSQDDDQLESRRRDQATKENSEANTKEHGKSYESDPETIDHYEERETTNEQKEGEIVEKEKQSEKPK